MKYWLVPDDVADRFDFFPTDLEAYDDEERFTISFRLRDTHGLLYHRCYGKLKAFEYVENMIEQGVIIKGIKRDEI